MANQLDYVDLGLSCADICRALDRGMNGKKLDDLSQSVCEAINQLTAWVEPVARSLDGSLTVLPITGLWQRSKRKSSNGADGMQSLDFSMRRMTRKRLQVGG
jgi:hypothetical protein